MEIWRSNLKSTAPVEALAADGPFQYSPFIYKGCLKLDKLPENEEAFKNSLMWLLLKKENFMHLIPKTDKLENIQNLSANKWMVPSFIMSHLNPI